MPHIALPEGVPGIRSALQYRPETARPLLELAEVLRRGPNSLTGAEREMIAAFVSARNDCRFCQTIHGALATWAPADPHFYRQRAALVAEHGYAGATLGAEQ